MFVANLATHTLSHVSTMAVWLFQDQPVAWDPISLWKQMGFIARTVVVILFIMSGWSIGVMIDRCHGIQRGTQAVAGICSRGGWRAARRQD